MPMPFVTTATADRHEELHLRLSALVRHVEAIAARRAAAEPDGETLRLAEDLLYAVRPFGGRRMRGLPAAAPTYSGLAAQLGSALASLEAFELRHTVYSPALKCVVWRVEGNDRHVVARLRPTPATPPASVRSARELEATRSKVARLFRSRYEAGYDDAIAGRPRLAPLPPFGSPPPGEGDP
mgnify:CR=1 FL=1